SSDFPEMADQLEAAMPPRLDPNLNDDDFGRFIHALPGILAVRHGLEDHRERAIDLLYEATQRFSMEFYIRPFLNRWPEETLARLKVWARDESYHVRRLVSEGTRPRLPWAKAVTITTQQALPLLDILHADPTRYVTRSVSNHLNDIAKKEPGVMLGRLKAWKAQGAQDARELDWMTRHALRVLIKQGHPGALTMIGYDPEAKVDVDVKITSGPTQIDDTMDFHVTLAAQSKTPVLVDYVIQFTRAGGKTSQKVFKLKQAVLASDESLEMRKSHYFKGGASTFQLYPGPHQLGIQVNGRVVAELPFELLPSR
ncbi:MAG: hypothetical protein ABJR23_19755, partial [Paracoccaceae bacterium]